MKRYSSTVKVGDKEVPIEIEQYSTLDEAIHRKGHTKALNLLNYAFALFQRARKRAEIEALSPKKKKGNLRGMCRGKNPDVGPVDFEGPKEA